MLCSVKIIKGLIHAHMKGVVVNAKASLLEPCFIPVGLITEDLVIGLSYSMSWGCVSVIALNIPFNVLREPRNSLHPTYRKSRGKRSKAIVILRILAVATRCPTSRHVAFVHGGLQKDTRSDVLSQNR
jgi:hypothetical protein